MADNKEPLELKEYAGGWISERKGTDVPAFLKYAYVVIATGCVAYLIVYLYGETTHSDRGVLVQQFNAATQTSEGLMYGVAALAALFFVLMILFAFRKPHED